MIDPKGDAESLLEYLQQQGRKARGPPLNWAAPGLLDPFSFGLDLSEKRTMATEAAAAVVADDRGTESR